MVKILIQSTKQQVLQLLRRYRETDRRMLP